MLKYFLEYTDVINILHRLNISDANFVGDTIEINGNVILQYPEVDDPLETIRGASLSIQLEAEATVDLDFTDLYSEQERTFQVEYIRDGITLFNGFLLPDGLFQDFVRERWIISLDCADGLQILQNLSYVQEDGLFFVGKQSELEIISNCLKRTSIEQNINTSINIFYAGLDENLDPLANVYLNADRFIKDDQETIQNCEEVLRSVLEKYGACITQQNGEWYIYKPNELFLNSSPTFFRYDFEGTPLAPATQVLDLSQNIGSQVNDAVIHHVNANQRIEIRPSIGAYRINYKYGNLQSLILNPLLEHNTVDIADWTILDASQLTLQPDGAGVEIERSTPEDPVLESSDFPVSAGGIIEFQSTLSFSAGSVHTAFYYVILDDGINDYYMTLDGEWTLTITSIPFTNKIPNPLAGEPFQPDNIAGNGTINPSIKSSITPVAGDISVQLLEPGGDEYDITFIIVGSSFIDNVNVANFVGLIEGEFHTVERTVNPSSVVKETKEIFVGDNTTDIFIGTIYQSDTSTPTAVWFREGIVEEKPILQIMGEETLRMSASPAQLFSGDIYGYMPYLTVLTIDSINGVFMPRTYSYDTRNNIISLENREIFGNEIIDIDYELTFDYGTTVKPTITG